MECEAFLMEMRDYMTLCRVKDSARAMLAGSYLTGQAKTMYAAHAAQRELSGEPVDWNFFQATLRSAYVPRAQVADELHIYFKAGFLVKVAEAARPGRMISVDDLLNANAVALQDVLKHGHVVSDLVRCQVFLAALPDCLRCILKLNEANEAHVSWAHLEEQARKRETQLVTAWAAYCDAKAAAAKAADVSRKRPHVETTEKPVARPFGTSTVGASLGGGSAPSASPSKPAGASPSGKPKDPSKITCFKCRKQGHFASDCPEKKSKK
jgi:hypothetical protein